MSKTNPKEALQIDEYRLDEEWVGQPALYFEFAAQLADARRDADDAKNRLEATKAETAREIRSSPDLYGLTKVTEAVVSENVALHDDVQSVQRELIEAKHNVDMLGAMVTALDHRRRALEKLVDLSLANYFAKPRASEGSREAMDKAEQKATWGKGSRKRKD